MIGVNMHYLYNVLFLYLYSTSSNTPFKVSKLDSIYSKKLLSISLWLPYPILFVICYWMNIINPHMCQINNFVKTFIFYFFDGVFGIVNCIICNVFFKFLLSHFVCIVIFRMYVPFKIKLSTGSINKCIINERHIIQ